MNLYHKWNIFLDNLLSSMTIVFNAFELFVLQIHPQLNDTSTYDSENE